MHCCIALYTTVHYCILLYSTCVPLYITVYYRIALYITVYYCIALYTTVHNCILLFSIVLFKLLHCESLKLFDKSRDIAKSGKWQHIFIVQTNNLSKHAYDFQVFHVCV